MKTINVTFTDEEYKQLLNAKNSANWHDYILNKCVQSDVDEKTSVPDSSKEVDQK